MGQSTWGIPRGSVSSNMNCFRAFSLVAWLVIALSDLGSSRQEGYEEIVNEIVNDRTFGQFQQKIQDWQACQTTCTGAPATQTCKVLEYDIPCGLISLIPLGSLG